MARTRTRTRASRQSFGDRAQDSMKRGFGRWLRFTLSDDRAKAFGIVSHVLLNWLGLFALIGAWLMLWKAHPIGLALATVLAVFYTMARAGRHLPARARTVEQVFGKTRNVFKHPRGTVDPANHVKVAQWASPKRPRAGAVTYDFSSSVADPTGRAAGERTLEAALRPMLKENEAVLFHHDVDGEMGFEVAPLDDERVKQQRVRQFIDQMVLKEFPTKRGADPVTVQCEWGDVPAAGQDLKAPVPSLITIDYGTFDVSDESWRVERERTFDARLPRTVKWLYDWSVNGQLSIVPTQPDGAEAKRKNLSARVRSTVEGAAGRARLQASARKAMSVTVTDWIEGDDKGDAANTPRRIRVQLGDADMSDQRAQRTVEGVLDRALQTEFPDRVWLHTWTHTTPTTLDSEAVPTNSVQGRRKTEENRLRQVVMTKFSGARTAEPPELNVTRWGKPENTSAFFADPASLEKVDWEANAAEIEVTFGAFDVTKEDTRIAFEQHFNSLVEGRNDWRYEWQSQLGQVHITAVPVLPTYIRFPDEDSEELAEWHSLFRDGKISLGPAKGGFAPTIDLNKSPHLLVGGSTGMGKSYLLNLILFGALYNSGAYELIIVDPKATDFTWASTYPNVRAYAVTDARKSIEQIREVVQIAHDEMIQRQNLLRSFGAESLKQLREFAREGRIDLREEDVPRRLLLFFDEGGSAFTASKDKDLKAIQDESRTLMEQLGMLARAMEVNIVMAAQKPSADNIGTAVREQLVNRIAVGHLNTDTSKQVLGNNLANTLLEGAGKGRGVMSDDQGRNLVFQTFYLPRVDETDLVDKTHTISGIRERVANRLEDQGWLCVPKETTATVNLPGPDGELAPKEVRTWSDTWVRSDKIEP